MTAKNDAYAAITRESDIQQGPGLELPLKFGLTLSLKPLIDYWLTEQDDILKVRSILSKRVREELEKAPELFEPITDPSVLDKHRSLLSLLMSAAISPAEFEEAAVAAATPFGTEFYATPGYKKIFPDTGLWECNTMAQMDPQVYEWGKALHIYAIILDVFYGLETDFDYPLVTRNDHPDSGLARYYKFEFTKSFVELRVRGELPELTDEERNEILSNLTNLELLTRLLPPELFEFHGFVVIRAVDVTDEQVISQLKRELIDQRSFTIPERFQVMEDLMRAYLRSADIYIGLSVLTQTERQISPENVRRMGNIFIGDEYMEAVCQNMQGSVYEEAILSGGYQLVFDLQKRKNRTIAEQILVDGGWRNFGVLPLHIDGRIIGIMELASKMPGSINGLNSLKLREIEPLLASALKRTLDELDTRVQAIIKEKCTAIHPSVEWRFQLAALRTMRDGRTETAVEMEPISFDGVYPLYGLSDIRNSSESRNEAIRADLFAQVDLALNIVKAARRHQEMPFLGKAEFELAEMKNRIGNDLTSGDELNIYEYLGTQIERLFDKLQDFGDEVADAIALYKSRIDPSLGMIYDRRKDFDTSMAMITDSISSILDEEQERAQDIFPHYFEKYKTDGVDHSVYIGASIAPEKKFDMMYLQNLRLWQIMVTCGIAHRMAALKTDMPIPLETAHLILVQDNPLAIRFRYDEKHFDVDGAYNIRYEIMKKRIDKARIAGTRERLTQPGKIAIVYSQSKEAEEYRQYIDYLQSTKCITDEVEDVDLEPLQGVQGLRALRITVNMDSSHSAEHLLEHHSIDIVKQFKEVAVP